MDKPLQIELFPAEEPALGSRPAARRPLKGAAAPRRTRTAGAPAGEEAMAERLEASGRYRILRRLEPRAVENDLLTRTAGQRLGIVLDTETTGLDHRKDEVIELGMVAFLFDEAGVGAVTGVFSALNEPGVPIGPEITRITGITPAMVAGHRLDIAAVERFVAGADLVIAHNARFDRPFCERLSPVFETKPWACSVAEVDWAARGFEGAKLGYLVSQAGYFHNGHRAVDDCHALLEVLATAPKAAGAALPFAELLASSARRRCRLFAEGRPFHTQDVLKGRGYRWSDGSGDMPKSWWREVEEAAYDEEVEFLRAEIYGGRMDLHPHARWLTALERYKG